MAKRHKFTALVPGGVLVAHVPDEGSEGVALARLIRDDPVWHEDHVTYQGLVKWTGGQGPIDFAFVGRVVS